VPSSATSGACPSWLAQCAARRAEIAQHVLDVWDQDAGDLFYSTGHEDVLRNRGGYEIALAAWRAIEESRGAGAGELMKQAHLAEIEALLKAELDRMSPRECRTA